MEKRKLERHLAKGKVLAALVFTKNDNSEYSTGSLVNISRSGLALDCSPRNCSLHASSQDICLVTMENEPGAFKEPIPCRIVYERASPVENNCLMPLRRYGVEFLEILALSEIQFLLGRSLARTGVRSHRAVREFVRR